MSKQEFLEKLRKGLSVLPKQEAKERLTFYSEMIDDRVEEGLSQEEAVCEIGSVEQIISQIVAEASVNNSAKEKAKQKRRLKAWEIVLLVLGSPIWLSLLIAAFAVLFSLYVSLWAVIISLWAVFAFLGACSIGGILAGIVFAIKGNTLTGIATIGAGILCAGLCIFAFYGCKAATKGVLMLTKKLAVWIKDRFIKKEEA